MTNWSDGYPPGCTQADHDEAFSADPRGDCEEWDAREAELRLDRELLERAEREMERADDRRERMTERGFTSQDQERGRTIDHGTPSPVPFVLADPAYAKRMMVSSRIYSKEDSP